MIKVLNITRTCFLAALFFAGIARTEPWKFGLIADTAKIQPLQGHPCCFQLVVVAADTIALEQGLVRRGRRLALGVCRGNHSPEIYGKRSQGGCPTDRLIHFPSVFDPLGGTQIPD